MVGQEGSWWGEIIRGKRKINEKIKWNQYKFSWTGSTLNFSGKLIYNNDELINIKLISNELINNDVIYFDELINIFFSR